MPTITSRQHPIVKAFRAVARGDEERALLDGWHLLHDAVAAGFAIETIAVSDAPQSSADAALIEQMARQPAVSVASVSPAVMNALSPVRTPTGVVALIKRPLIEWSQLLSPAPPLVVVGIDVQDPGNAGAIIRAAEAGGATGVVLAGESADAWGWKALRASMGSTLRMPVHQQRDARAACAALRNHGVSLIGTVPHDGLSMYDADLCGQTALVFGGEGGGLSSPILEVIDRLVTIPMQRPVESLNVAVATGVLIYEARRQRQRS